MPGMDIVLLVLLFLSSAVSFIYGAVKFFKPKTALFKQIVVSSLGCFMLGRLYNLLISVADKIPEGFNIGLLSLFGGFMFLFSADFGQMDGLVDGKQKEFTKYRLLSLLSPAFILLTAGVGYIMSNGLSLKISYIPVYIMIMLSSYFNFKHLLLPDVDFGILKSIRKYNFFALMLCIVTSVDLSFSFMNNIIFNTITSVMTGVFYIAIIVSLERGSKKWTL